MDPTRVRVYYDNARLLKDQPDLYYQYSTPSGVIVLGSEEVLHFKSHNTLDGLVGISVREQLASTIQGGIKAQKMLNRMTDSGMTAKAVLQYTGSLNDNSVKLLKEQVEQYMKGDISEKDGRNVVPIPVGFTLTPLNMKLADSQFLELRQYNALQIASAFGVKPYQVGDYTKSSYASAEAQQLSFLVDTLLYNVKQYEEEVGYKLLTNTEEAAGYHVKFNTGVLLRADQKTQIDTLSTAVSNFLLTPNEAREKLDLPAKEGGDRLLGNGASIPVELTGEQYQRQAQQANAFSPDPEKQREEDKAWLKEILTETLREMRSPA
jgi:HK97 family phage portal protein